MFRETLQVLVCLSVLISSSVSLHMVRDAYHRPLSGISTQRGEPVFYISKKTTGICPFRICFRILFPTIVHKCIIVAWPRQLVWPGQVTLKCMRSVAIWPVWLSFCVCCSLCRRQFKDSIDAKPVCEPRHSNSECVSIISVEYIAVIVGVVIVVILIRCS